MLTARMSKAVKKLMINCLELRIGGKDVSLSTLRMEGRNIHMTWGSTLFYATINGTRQAWAQT